MAQQQQQQLLKCPEHDMYVMVVPPVTSLTLLRGWSVESQADLKSGVNTLLAAHPLLAGKLVSVGSSGEVAIEALAHKITLTVVDGPSDFVVPGSLPEQIVALQTLESLFPSILTGNEQLEAGSPLFSVTVATLPGGYACLCVQMAHMLGDGACYYKVCDMLNAATNRHPLPRMEWMPSPKSAVMAPHFNADDEFKALKSWMPAFVAKLQDPNFQPRVTATILDTAALKALKAEYTATAEGKVEYLSTNDIIVAGINEITESTLSSMIANMRNRNEQKGMGHELSGNYQRNIIYPKAAAASNPVYVRSKLATDFYHYEAGEMPADPLVECDLMINTSWCQFAKFVEPPSCEVVAHAPPTFFVTAFPFEVIICFKADKKGTIGLLHNLPLQDPACKARVAASSIFRRMILSPERVEEEKKSE